MAESNWLIAGLIIGIPIGIALGWLLAQAILKPVSASSSVVFDRDEQGRIAGIHYIPHVAQTKFVPSERSSHEPD